MIERRKTFNGAEILARRPGSTWATFRLPPRAHQGDLLRLQTLGMQLARGMLNAVSMTRIGSSPIPNLLTEDHGVAARTAYRKEVETTLKQMMNASSPRSFQHCDSLSKSLKQAAEDAHALAAEHWEMAREAKK